MIQQIATINASEIAAHFYGITSEASVLPGDCDANFKLVTAHDASYLLKIWHADASEAIIDLQLEILKYLSEKDIAITVPTVVHNSVGDPKTTVKLDNGDHRLVTVFNWVAGRLWATVTPKKSTLRNSLGVSAGSITKNLIGFSHPAANRKFDWNLADASWTKDHIALFTGTKKELITYFQNKFDTLKGIYNKLPKSVIHNDVNHNNIVVSTHLKDPEVTGIIDFGDTVYSQTINDLAIVLAYAIMELPDPLAAAVDVIRGYHKEYSISEEELQCLYTLVGMRLVTTVTKAALRKAEDPTNRYWTISEQPAWELLKKWCEVNEHFAYYCFREAFGLSAHPNEERFLAWADTNQISLNVLFPTIPIETTHLLDMSVGSTILGNLGEYSDPEIAAYKLAQFQKKIPNTLLANGYLEIRPFYTTAAFKSEGNNGPQYRTVHLGTDFWVPAETPVHSPYDGKVKIVHHNDYDKDYGPMVILEHQAEDFLFYTLYGHLTLSSLSLLKAGQQISAGTCIGYIGAPHENGNWAPHLHFQIILDLLDNNENFNGVALPSEIPVWSSICPDPNRMFKESLTPSEATKTEKELLDFRERHLGKGLSVSYSKPLHIVRGQGVHLLDIEGRKYLDTVNNVNHVGHQHPAVVAAGQAQMAVLNTNTRYLHQELVTYSKALLKKLPPELCVLHFVNSGSEANELALRMAKTVTGQNDTIAIEVGYHGNTNAVMEVSSYKFDGKGGAGKPNTTHILPLPDPFRGIYASNSNCGSDYAAHTKTIIENLNKKNRGVAAFIGETLISCGGQITPPKNYFKEVYQHVREAGGLCIADEVQTGFGRVGKTFWAFELYDVLPDIVTMGKPAGNGHPLAIVACTKEVAEAFNTGMEFFNTFGGNPVSCAIGRTVLEVIETEKLQQNALRIGAYLKKELQSLRAEFPIIGDVRGEGLFLGIELTNATKQPLTDHASYLADRMRELGILMSTDGPDYNVLKIKPPMIFSEENAKELIFRLNTVLEEDFMKHY